MIVEKINQKQRSMSGEEVNLTTGETANLIQDTIIKGLKVEDFEETLMNREEEVAVEKVITETIPETETTPTTEMLHISGPFQQDRQL